jgi:putative PEP-CTERM system TPR-repeat lipoprotein
MSACSQKTVEEQIAAAEKLTAEGEYSAAIIELKNAVLSQPQNAEARYQLGQLQFTSGAFEEAEKEMRRSLELNYQVDSAYPIFIKAIFYQNDFERALLELEKQPHISDVRHASTIALFSYLAKLKSGRKDLVIPSDLEPEHLLIAQSYQSLAAGKPDIAESIANKFITPSIEPFEKHILKGNIYSLKGDHVDAIVEYGSALKIFPNYYLARFLLAEQLINDQQLSRANDEINLLLEINPNSGYANYLKSLVYFYQDDYESALKLANLALQYGAKSAEANFIAGTSAYKTGRIESALRYLTAATNNLPAGHIAHRLLAQVKLELGYVSDVADDLSMLNITGEQSSEIYGLAALKNLQMGNIDEANQYIEKATMLAPESPVTLLRKGFIDLESGELNASKNLAKALEIDPSIDEAWVLLAEAKYKESGLDSAIQVAKEWQQTNQVNGLLLEGVMYLKAKKESLATAKFEQALTLDPEHKGALRYVMIAKARTGEFEAALELGSRLIERTPDNVQNIIDVVNLMISLNRENDIIPYLEAFAETHPANQAPLSALAFVHIRQNHPEQAIRVLKKIENPTTFSYFQALGDSYMKLKRIDDAIAAYEDWTNKFPNDDRGWYRLIAAHQAKLDAKGALEQVDRARTFFPRDSRLILLEAHLSAATGKFDDSRKAIAQLESSNKELLELSRVKGLLALNEKRYADALPFLEAANEVHPSFSSLRLVAFALAGLNRAGEGLTLLQEELTKSTTSINERLIVAEYAMSNNFLEDAIAQYNRILEIKPDDFATLNNLASALYLNEDYDQAQGIAKKALDIAPDSAYALDTYGIILVQQGDVQQGLTLIEKAIGKEPNNKEIQLHWAQALIASGDLNRAKLMLKKIRPITPVEKELHQELTDTLAND